MALQLFGKPEKYAPASLSEEGKSMRKAETNFLTFKDVRSKRAGKEYQTAADPKNPDGSTNWAVQLDDTFAQPGVWKFRYHNIAPDVSGVSGFGYIDKGVPEEYRVELQRGAELMSAKRELALRDGDEAVSLSNSFELGNFGYEQYGYKEQGSGANRVENMQAQAINGFRSGDTSICPAGLTWNGLGCVPETGGQGICAFGWESKNGRCELTTRQHIA